MTMYPCVFLCFKPIKGYQIPDCKHLIKAHVYFDLTNKPCTFLQYSQIKFKFSFYKTLGIDSYHQHKTKGCDQCL